MARAWKSSPPRPIALRSTRARLARTAGVTLAVLVVALALAGQIIFLVHAARSGALTSSGTSVQAPATGSLSHRVAVVLDGALGPSDRGVPRFRVATIPERHGRRRAAAVSVTWAINDDLSAGTVGNGAQADVYVALRDLFTSGLPLTLVKLTGTYPMSDGTGHRRETVVMRLAMSRSVARTVGGMGWENFDPQTLWPLVTRLYVNPQVQPLAGE